MYFGRVYGRARFSTTCDEGALHVEVSLESGSRISIVRDECVSLPVGADEQPLEWWADQFTQETIGTVLAELGWEAFATSEQESERASTDDAVVTYVVRKV